MPRCVRGVKLRRVWPWAVFLCVVTVGFWSFRSSDAPVTTPPDKALRETRSKGAPSAAPLPAARTASSASPLAQDAASVVSRHWPKGKVRDERVEELSGERTRWIQWIQTDGPFPQVRAELTFASKTNGGGLIEETYYLADSVLVERPAGLTPEQFASRLQRHGFRVGQQYSFSPAVRVFVPEPLHLDSVPEALTKISNEEPSWQALPDHLSFSDALPNDYNPRELWSLTRVRAPSAWQVSTGSSTIVVAIIDSGIDYNHPDLVANIWKNPLEFGNGIDDDGNGLIDDVNGWDFAGHDNDPFDEESHGTHVAGIIGAVGNNAQGITGVAQRIKLLGLRTGNTSLATSAVIQALDYVVSLKNRGVPIAVVNNSYTSTTFNSLQRDSIQRARDSDILFVASSGNDARNIDQNGLLYPVGYTLSNVIGVASTNLGDTLSDFSNWGTTSVHIAAPGSAIISTVPGGLYAIKDGTSMASPLVAGAAALLRSAEPTLSALQLKNRLITSSVPVSALTNRVSSGARLDVQNLVNPLGSIPVLTPLGPIARVHGLESVTQSLVFSVKGTSEVNGSVQSEIPVTWTKAAGPGAVTFTQLGDNQVKASFSAEGLYKLIASATAGGITTQLERTVAVGTNVAVSSSQLMARWTFNETSGAPQDSSGQGRHGTLIDGPTPDAGPGSEAALRFTGTLSAMKFTAPAPTQVTLAGWVRMDGAGNSIFPRMINMPSYYLFLGRDVDGTADANIGSVKFLANWTGTDGVWHSPQRLVTNNAWYHVAATYDGSKGLRELPRLYLNGRELEVGAQTAPAGTIELVAGNGYLGNNEEKTRALLGRLSDVRVYGRPLGSEEIALLAREANLQDLRRWEVVVTSSTPTDAVLGLRLADGRLPGGTLTAVWREITGPGSPSFLSTNGTQATVRIGASGPHTIAVDLYENEVMLSREVTLTLPGAAAPPVLPGFVRSPGDRLAAVGSSITLEVEATGSPPLSYQWLRNGVPISGAILPQLLLSNLKLEDAGNFSVRVTNVAGSATSGTATLTVLNPPVITTQPKGLVAAAGSRVSFTVAATGSPPLTYQWFKDGAPVSGATSSTYVIESAANSQAGRYTVTVTNAVGATTSSVAELEILQAPAIVSQPMSQTVLAGRTIIFDVQVSGTVPYTFAWFKDGVEMPGRNSPTLRFTIVRVEDSGTYTFRVTNAVGSATTTPIVLRVVSPPVITRQPMTQAAALGSSVTFRVEATGTNPLTYQWMRNHAAIPGQTGPQLVINPVIQESVATYSVTITNEVGSVRSEDAYLDIVPLPRVTQHPAGVTAALGGDAVLDVGVAGASGSVFYRWLHNGVPVPGANTSRLTLSGLTLAQAGLYYVELTNSGGMTYSRPAVVAVTIPEKTAGAVATRPEWQDIVHPNGNSYDQFVLSGSVGAIRADTGQVSRLSFIDPQGDIVQVELSGRGTLTLSLANATGPSAPELYDQPGVVYMKGQATLVLADSDANTHVAVYSVGPANNPGAVRPQTTYEGWATLRAVGIHSTAGVVGGVRMGNARFEGTFGLTGLWASNVSTGTLVLSDIAAFSTALPVLAASSTTEVTIAGGSLFQPNERPLVIDGVAGVRFRQGGASTGAVVGPQTLLGRVERNGVDVSATIVLTSP